MHKKILLILLILFSVSCIKKKTVKHTGKKIKIEDLHSLIDKRKKDSDLITNFNAEGFFSYKDQRQEINLTVKVWFDLTNNYSRISFYGNLNELWGDVVLYKKDAKLYFPIQKKIYSGTDKDFDLYPFCRVHIQLSELLKLTKGKIYLIPDYAKKSGYITKKFLILFIHNKNEIQKVFFDKKTLNIVQSNIYKNKKEKGRLYYSFYKKINNNLIPSKTVLKVVDQGIKAVIWFNKIKLNYKFIKGDEVINTAKDVETVKL